MGGAHTRKLAGGGEDDGAGLFVLGVSSAELTQLHATQGTVAIDHRDLNVRLRWMAGGLLRSFTAVFGY